MIAKFGFVLVLAVFGALMFAAGLLAPESIRQPMSTLAQQVAAKVKLPVKTAAGQGTAKEVGASPEAGKTDAAGGGAAAASGPAAAGSAQAAAPAAQPDPIPIESLLLPTPLPDKGQYAIQAGQFTDPAQADALGKRITELKLPFDKVLDVVDQAGRRWSVVPVGPYASADEARTARAVVAQDLQVNDVLPLILLPPEKPKS